MASVERRSGKQGDVFVVRFRDSQGRQRSKSLPTKRDALAFASKVTTQLHEGDWVDPALGRVRFRDFHARWEAARTVSPSRSSTEKGQARNHILPRWGDVPLSKIRPLDVDQWLKDSTAGNATKAMALQQFKLCLDAAVREGLIRSNPAAKTKKPTVAKKRVTTSDVLSAEELDRVVAAMPDHWKALVYLSGWLGWRWSEAMGLRVRDVDLDNGLIYVGNEVVIEADGKMTRRAGGKTAAATRTVPLPDPAVAVVRWHMDRLFMGAHPDAPLFATEGGHTPIRSNFRRIFQKAVAEAGVAGRGVNMRQLRHTAASLMLSNGLDILDVQERLGHARGSVTLDVYGRILTSRRVAGTERMGAVMAGSDSWVLEAASQGLLPAPGRAG